MKNSFYVFALMRHPDNLDRIRSTVVKNRMRFSERRANPRDQLVARSTEMRKFEGRTLARQIARS